jgi:RNA polymerase sigma factor (TIGR02999 family)
MTGEKQTAEGQVTRLLRRIESGDRSATEELLPLVYHELRRLARSRMARERPGQTLTPTALVHEAYLRLVKDESIGWDDRGHFFAAAAEAMRRILIERARRYAARRHGGGQQRVTRPDLGSPMGMPPEDLLALDEALTALESKDRSMADVVKLRFFTGLTVPETAAARALSNATVHRHWAAARAWLQREITRRA